MINKLKQMFSFKKKKVQLTKNLHKNRVEKKPSARNSKQDYHHPKKQRINNSPDKKRNLHKNDFEEIIVEFVDTSVSQPKDDWQVAKLPEYQEGKKMFFDFALPSALLRSLYENKFFYCTPIQEQTFQYSLQGLDIAGKAQTGTGKTVAFLIAIFNHFIRHPLARQTTATPRCVIIAPTRELAMQISAEAKLIGKYCDANIATLYGGVKYEKQIEMLKGRVDILVGTPGRLTDCWRKNWVNLKKVEVVVLDEADKMLDMGFIRDIQRLLVNMPLKKNRLTLFFSATFDDKIKRLLTNFLKANYKFIEVQSTETITTKINQIIYTVQRKDKLAIILWHLKEDNVSRMIIFVNRRDEAYKLSQELINHNISLATLSSDIRQHKRQQAVKDFECGKIQVVVATDVMGRGIHINNVSHVINYELPYEAEDYLHRIGRTGRAGKNGKAISFACEASGFQLPLIEDYIGSKLSCQKPPAEMLEMQ